MVEILQNKNASSRFQILVEIAANGPGIHQNAIAANLGLTPQAISIYIHQLLDEGLIVSVGRSSYKVSATGVNWMLKELRQLNDYVSVVQKAVTNITTCAAIAGRDIREGQPVGLEMKNGLLFATGPVPGGARGIALSNAKKGDDVDISRIEGVVIFARGKVTILQIPAIHRGGSRKADRKRLKAMTKSPEHLGTIGIEALTALRSVGIEPRYLYGVGDAAIEAANCGLSFVVVCTEDAVPDLIKDLKQEEVNYELVDIGLKARSA